MNKELKKWCDQAEDTRIQSAREWLKLLVGKKYSKEKIKKLEDASHKHAKFFLKQFKKPEELYVDAVGSIAGAKTYKLSLKLDELRKKKICSSKHKYQNKKVCWTSWRSFVVKADDKARKQVYDEFIKKTPVIAPTIKKSFDICKQEFSKYKVDPLQEYLKEHHISLKQLKKVLTQLRTGVKKSYKKEFNHYTQKYLNREPKYYDDLYFMRNIVFEDMIKGFKNVKPLAQIKKTMRMMGLDPSKIQVDSKARPHKDPSPFCMGIKIPGEVCISFKAENPLNTTSSIFHEFGHAIHDSSIDPKLSYWKRYGMPMGLAETFSIFFENILLNKNYLTKELKLPSDYADEFIEKTQFINKLAVAFYTGNSLFKIKFWEKNLAFNQCSKEYAKEIQKSMGLKIPGKYWLLHHILPERILYVPSYMLADTNAAKMHAHVESKYGKYWWRNKKSGKYVYDLMRPGTDSPMANFSKANAKKYLKQINC